jgi:ribose transport system substrate-binding protein
MMRGIARQAGTARQSVALLPDRGLAVGAATGHHLVVGVWLLVAAACGRGGSAGSGDGARPDARAAGGTPRRIGVSLLTKEQEFYRQLEGGLRDEAAAKGYQLLLTSGDFDLARQQSEIDNFVVQRVDAIIVCPVDSKGIGPAIQRAEAAGIPVFTADIRAYGVPVTAHVASDNREGGRQAATFMAQAIGKHGLVGIIGQAETETGYDRSHAFTEALTQYPNIRVVGELNGGGVRDRALKVAEDMLQAHPDLSGIFAINDEMALGAMAAARARGKTAADFTIVGYDADPEAVVAIRGNTLLKADIVQHPHQIGVGAIDAVAKYLAHHPVDSVVTIPVVTLDAHSPDPAGAAVGAQPASPSTR